MQWWFVQGVLDLPGGVKRRFMAAFFQASAAPGGPPAHMLLLHVLEGAGRQPEIRSRITPGIADVVLRMASRLAAAHLPETAARLLVGLHMREAETAAQRDGIEIVSGPDLGPATFALTWDGFVLAQQGNELHLCFPIGAESADLILTPERRWLDDRGERLDAEPTASYAYQCCPRLAVRGTLGGRPVSGRAWLDRQWGPIDGWLLTRTKTGLRPLGWDWFGLSFDSGEDLLAMRQFVAGGVRHREGFAILFDSVGAAARVRGGFAGQALETWRSPRTGIAYPVHQRLRLAAIDAEIDVVPLADDQEIPVFGVPAIWQGAVTAEGRIGSRRLSGDGRLELFGYGYAPSIRAYLARAVRRRLGTKSILIGNG